jgi:CRP-like cAMP-binding protein
MTASLLVLLNDGTSVGVAIIGNEGMIGLPLAVGLQYDNLQALVLISGSAALLRAGAFRRVLQASAPLTDLLNRYRQLLMEETVQAVGCNRLHTMRQRCARWILETHDRVSANTFRLTQELLATCLGVRRATVTAAATSLLNDGLIAYRRGQITVVERAGLEEASCSCYRVAIEARNRLFGPTE